MPKPVNLVIQRTARGSNRQSDKVSLVMFFLERSTLLARSSVGGSGRGRVQVGAVHCRENS